MDILDEINNLIEKIKMEKLSFGEEWEKEEPKREAYLKYLKEHPLSREEMMEQIKRNREMRFKNMKSRNEKEKNK